MFYRYSAWSILRSLGSLGCCANKKSVKGHERQSYSDISNIRCFILNLLQNNVSTDCITYSTYNLDIPQRFPE